MLSTTYGELNINNVDNVNDLPVGLSKFVDPQYKIDVYEDCCIYREFLTSCNREGEIETTGLQLIVYSRVLKKFYQKVVTKDDIRETVFNLEDLENVFRACFDDVPGYFLEIVHKERFSKKPFSEQEKRYSDVLELRFECKEVIKTYSWMFVLIEKRANDMDEIDQIFKRYHDPIYNMMHSWLQTQLDTSQQDASQQDASQQEVSHPTETLEQNDEREPYFAIHNVKLTDVKLISRGPENEDATPPEDTNSAENDSWKDLYASFLVYLDKIKADVQNWCSESKKERFMLPYLNETPEKEKDSPKEVILTTTKKSKKTDDDSVESESYVSDSNTGSETTSEPQPEPKKAKKSVTTKKVDTKKKKKSAKAEKSTKSDTAVKSSKADKSEKSAKKKSVKKAVPKKSVKKAVPKKSATTAPAVESGLSTKKEKKTVPKSSKSASRKKKTYESVSGTDEEDNFSDYSNSYGRDYSSNDDNTEKSDYSESYSSPSTSVSDREIEEEMSDSPRENVVTKGGNFTYEKFMDRAMKRIQSEEPNWPRNKVQTKALGEWESYIQLINAMIPSKKKSS